MDSSTPPPAESSPERLRLAGPAELIAAADRLVDSARFRIRVFDHDLSELGWEQASRHDALRRFLLRSHSARVQFLVRDAHWLATHAPRLARLRRSLGHQIEVHQCGADGRRATDALVVVDNAHFLHRFHSEQPGATAGFSDPVTAGPLAARFDLLWTDSQPAAPVTTLGL